MNIDEAMEQGLAAAPESAEHVLAQALASANSQMVEDESQLESYRSRIDELQASIAEREVAARASERLRIAEAFETSSSAFPEGLTVETLVFMLRLGT